jgi:hypothetical protein
VLWLGITHAARESTALAHSVPVGEIDPRRHQTIEAVLSEGVIL